MDTFVKIRGIFKALTSFSAIFSLISTSLAFFLAKRLILSWSSRSISCMLRWWGGNRGMEGREGVLSGELKGCNTLTCTPSAPLVAIVPATAHTQSREPDRRFPDHACAIRKNTVA